MIVVSGYAFPDDIERARQRACDAVLVKPCEPEVLCQTVLRLIGSAEPAVDPRRREGPRTLEAEILRADFLCRHAVTLRMQAVTASARAEELRGRRVLSAGRSAAAGSRCPSVASPARAWPARTAW